jgi:hypothetical protein
LKSHRRPLRQGGNIPLESLARRYGFTTHGAADRAEHVVPAPAKRAAHHEQRKRLYEIEFPETRHGGDRRSSGHSDHLIERYTADAARTTGQSERTIRREVARAEKIPDIVSVAGTSLIWAGSAEQRRGRNAHGLRVGF